MSDATNPATGAGLYQHSASLFDLRYSQKDYAREAERFVQLMGRLHPSAETLLDVACGTGRHLEHLSTRYRCEGLDRSRDLLQTAAKRVGNIPLHAGDMTDFHLGRSFDLVTCFFGSIAYTGHVELVRKSVQCMARHLSPDGLIFIEPYLTPDVYREGEVVLNSRKTPDSTLAWMYVMHRKGSVAAWEIHWLLGTRDGDVKHFVENEELLMLPIEEYIAIFREAGLDVIHNGRGLHGYGAFLARQQPWSPEDAAAIRDAFAD